MKWRAEGWDLRKEMEQRGVYIFIFWSHSAVGGILGPWPETEPSLAVRVLSPNCWTAWEIHVSWCWPLSFRHLEHRTILREGLRLKKMKSVMWWSEGWWVGRRCLKRGGVVGDEGLKSSEVEIPWNKRTHSNTMSWMKERERKVYKVKEGIEGSFKRDSQESLGRQVWILETALAFLRNVLTEDFGPKGLKYAHYWINGQFVHSDLLLLKGTVCSPLTSAETSPREQGRKPASPNEVSYHRFLNQRHRDTWTFPLWKMGFIPSGWKTQFLPPESYHRKGL